MITVILVFVFVVPAPAIFGAQRIIWAVPS